MPLAVSFLTVALFRVALTVMLSLPVIAIAIPVRADLSPHQQKCCCAPGAKEKSGQGCDEQQPAKPAQEPPCCTGCLFGLAVIPIDSKLRIFAGSNGEKFFVQHTAVSSRTDRPPVPPPRALLPA
jgi:hypothetical protein